MPDYTIDPPAQTFSDDMTAPGVVVQLTHNQDNGTLQIVLSAPGHDTLNSADFPRGDPAGIDLAKLKIEVDKAVKHAIELAGGNPV